MAPLRTTRRARTFQSRPYGPRAQIEQPTEAQQPQCPYNASQLEHPPLNKTKENGAHFNIHMLLVIIGEGHPSASVQAEIDEGMQKARDIAKLKKDWPRYPATYMTITAPTTAKDLIEAMKASQECDAETLYIICYSGEAKIIHNTYQWCGSSGDISFNAEEFMRHLCAESESHVLFLLDCDYRPPWLPVLQKSRRGHVSVLAPLSAEHWSRERIIPFHERCSQHFVDLSKTSLDAGGGFSHGISDLYLRIIRDKLLFVHPRFDSLRDGSNSQTLKTLIPDEVLRYYAETSEAYENTSLVGGKSAPDYDHPKETCNDPKIYSQVHVLVISWKESGFSKEADLERQLCTIVGMCYGYYWEPKRISIPDGTASDCTRYLSEAIEDFVSHYGRDPSHLLIIAYSGHGSRDKTSGEFFVQGKGRRPRIVWNDIQRSVQESSYADVLFFIDACHSAAAQIQWGFTHKVPRPKPGSRQELIAACGRESTSHQRGPAALSNTWTDLLGTYIHSSIRQTTESLHTKANERRTTTRSFVRVNLINFTPPIVLEPCYSALHTLVARFYGEYLPRTSPGRFCVIFVSEARDCSSTLLADSMSAVWLWEATTIAECKLWYAEGCNVSKQQRLSLKAGRTFPEDTDTLTKVKENFTKPYTDAAQLIVFEAFWDMKVSKPNGDESCLIKQEWARMPAVPQFRQP